MKKAQKTTVLHGRGEDAHVPLDGCPSSGKIQKESTIYNLLKNLLFAPNFAKTALDKLSQQTNVL
jgi:hypothetical protein